MSFLRSRYASTIQRIQNELEPTSSLMCEFARRLEKSCQHNILIMMMIDILLEFWSTPILFIWIHFLHLHSILSFFFVGWAGRRAGGIMVYVFDISYLVTQCLLLNVIDENMAANIRMKMAWKPFLIKWTGCETQTILQAKTKAHLIEKCRKYVPWKRKNRHNKPAAGRSRRAS